MSTISTNIKDKVVFITGAAHGIGKSILTHFCAANADVIFCDVDKESGNKLCNSLSDYRCQFYAAVNEDAKALAQLKKEHARLQQEHEILKKAMGIISRSDL